MTKEEFRTIRLGLISSNCTVIANNGGLKNPYPVVLRYYERGSDRIVRQVTTYVHADAKFVSTVLEKSIISDGYKTRSQLVGMTDRIFYARSGSLLFKFDGGTCTGVAIYFSGKQYIVKGTSVICETYVAKQWQRIGWIKGL